jgi:antitoxin MazE
MDGKIEQWDGTLAVRIPGDVAARLQLEEGTRVRIDAEAERLTVTPRRYTLETLIEGITPENRHPAVDWGPPVGNEWTAQCVGDDY